MPNVKINKNTTITYNYKYEEEFNNLEKFIKEHIDSPALQTPNGLKKQLNRDWNAGQWDNITIYNINETIKKIQNKDVRSRKITERTIQLFLQQSSLAYLVIKITSLLKISDGNPNIYNLPVSFRHQIYKIGNITSSLHIIIFNIQMGMNKTDIGTITITYNINHTQKNIKITFYFLWKSEAIANFMGTIINKEESFRTDNIYEDIANELDKVNNNNNNLTNVESINSAHKKNNTSFIDTPFIDYYKKLNPLTSLFRQVIHISTGH